VRGERSGSTRPVRAIRTALPIRPPDEDGTALRRREHSARATPRWRSRCGTGVDGASAESPPHQDGPHDGATTSTPRAADWCSDASRASNSARTSAGSSASTDVRGRENRATATTSWSVWPETPPRATRFPMIRQAPVSSTITGRSTGNSTVVGRQWVQARARPSYLWLRATSFLKGTRLRSNSANTSIGADASPVVIARIQRGHQAMAGITHFVARGPDRLVPRRSC